MEVLKLLYLRVDIIGVAAASLWEGVCAARTIDLR